MSIHEKKRKRKDVTPFGARSNSFSTRVGYRALRFFQIFLLTPSLRDCIYIFLGACHCLSFLVISCHFLSFLLLSTEGENVGEREDRREKKGDVRQAETRDTRAALSSTTTPLFIPPDGMI